MLAFPTGTLLHLALDPRVEVVEEIVVRFLRGGLALDGPRDVRLVTALDRSRAALLGDLFLELFDDEIGGIAGFPREFLVKGGEAFLLDSEGLG